MLIFVIIILLTQNWREYKVQWILNGIAMSFLSVSALYNPM